MERSLTGTVSAALAPTARVELTMTEGADTPHAGPASRDAASLDRIGATLGFLCALHCLAVPLLLGVLPAMGLGFIADHTFDLALLAVASVVALFAARSGLRTHGDRRVVIGLVVAVLLLATGHIIGEEGLVGRLPSITGGFMLFGLHIANLRLSRQAACCR